MSGRIITKQILNENTGELEYVSFYEIKDKKRIKAGFRMVYTSYDEALMSIVKSNKDLEILLYIRDMFTYARIENIISPTDISKDIGVAKSKVDDIIKRTVESNLIFKVSRGVYRLNPFMYLPYRCNAEELQQEWKELTKGSSNE